MSLGSIGLLLDLSECFSFNAFISVMSLVSLLIIFLSAIALAPNSFFSTNFFNSFLPVASLFTTLMILAFIFPTILSGLQIFLLCSVRTPPSASATLCFTAGVLACRLTSLAFNPGFLSSSFLFLELAKLPCDGLLMVSVRWCLGLRTLLEFRRSLKGEEPLDYM
eukprot:TRINITY_DN7046_c0_g1_i4.p1 TRINITY_DN7046_c0_g1~~TRINITY_DN7046_c0_g1_i4.p1  ORF type:complete len:165 (+),score=4.49 TRINITY_DN7046_c0_g1_i4:462-956(+)